MSVRGSGLSEEDRIVWETVARTALPLKGKGLRPAAEEPPPSPPDAGQAPQGHWEPALPAPPVRRDRAPVRHFDPQTRARLSKGSLRIGARVDLHGLTQSQAHGLLLSFLGRAHAAGLRYVLVITGKGASFGSEGALKRAVPAWLATPAFCELVSGHDDAAREHGGSGAIYVRLRRRREPG